MENLHSFGSRGILLPIICLMIFNILIQMQLTLMHSYMQWNQVKNLLLTILEKTVQVFWVLPRISYFELVFFLSGCCVRYLVSWSLQKIHDPQKASCFLIQNCLPWHHQPLSPTGSHSATHTYTHIQSHNQPIMQIILLCVFLPPNPCVFLCVFYRQSELLVLLNRQLERCLRNSKCIDTESLCVVSGEKVLHTSSYDNIYILIQKFGVSKIIFLNEIINTFVWQECI